VYFHTLQKLQWAFLPAQMMADLMAQWIHLLMKELEIRN